LSLRGGVIFACIICMSIPFISNVTNREREAVVEVSVYKAKLDPNALQNADTYIPNAVTTDNQLPGQQVPHISPAKAFEYSMSILDSIKNKEDEATPLLEQLALSHEYARGLPIAMKEIIYQKEIDTLLAAITDTETQLAYGIRDFSIEDYAGALNSLEKLTVAYQETYEPFTKKKIVFTEHNVHEEVIMLLRNATEARCFESGHISWEIIFSYAKKIGIDDEMLVSVKDWRLEHWRTEFPPGSVIFQSDWENMMREATELGLDGQALQELLSVSIRASKDSSVSSEDMLNFWMESASRTLNVPMESYSADNISRLLNAISEPDYVRSSREAEEILKQLCDKVALGVSKFLESREISLRDLSEMTYHEEALVLVLAHSQNSQRLIDLIKQRFHEETQPVIQNATAMLQLDDATKIPFVIDHDLWSYCFAYARHIQVILQRIEPDQGLLTEEEKAAFHDIFHQCGLLLQRANTPETPAQLQDFVINLEKLLPLLGTETLEDVRKIYLNSLEARTVDHVSDTVESESPRDIENMVSLARLYQDRLRSYRSLPEHGLNLVYGPLCDVARKGTPGYMEKVGRVFAHDPVVTNLLAALTIEATHQDYPQMGFVIKHAPGIGAIDMNPEWEGLVADYRDKAAILRELSAFTATLRGHSQVAVMVTGAAYPNLESETATLRPACLSPDVCSLLRANFGEDVVLFSDDLGTDAIKSYYGISNFTADDCAKSIADATLAGVDVCLFYSHSKDMLFTVLDELEKTTEAGQVSREVLEASVLRILRYKQILFPDNEVLRDPEQLVKRMSIKELWAQKIIYPCYCVADSKSYIGMGVGGLTFEGVKNLEYYTQMTRELLRESAATIPPFMANNSPQETAGSRSPMNPVRQEEIDLLAELATQLETAYPDGVPQEVAEQILSSLR